ncbi:MAG: heparinase II/III family protein [Algibacter sp.]
MIYLKGSLKNKRLYVMLFFVAVNSLFAQVSIPSNKVINSSNLPNYLTAEAKQELGGNKITTLDLANYLRQKFSECYFYDWQKIDERFSNYKRLYPNAEKSHQERASDHMGKYPSAAQWVLPFNYKNGKPVNAYALRHLARQHKMVDIAYQYHYQNKDAKYLNYFKNQLQSLNIAFHKNEYEKIEDGNGVYEAFRSGYRVLNWLHIHNMFLGEESYTDADQLTTIATLLQHGAHLYERNAKFHAGNHQTRGLSALAMLSILLKDFEGTDKWYDRAMNLLEEHLRKEINEDGFQFERTVHYHMSDIGNYYYVYQLAKISKLDVKPFWQEKLKSLFVSLTKIAYPNKYAPVLSDDTDAPWAEKNNISGALTLGYLLFESPKMGYFANNQVESKMFWYSTDKQLEMLKNIESKTPTMKSVDFPITGYYIMREGWKVDDKMMVISAGLDAKKPDHQHGDMLGIQAVANDRVILPNYQVRYSLKDLELFKNSMTKNVALVDDALQGKQYTSNKGGSGFGKFRELPNPNVIVWNSNKDLDVFIGSHDGFKNIGVEYSRQVIYIKDDFWIVKDNFTSHKTHEYKQVWQGHYSLEASPNLIRSTFDNASGLDIYQIKKIDTVTTSGQRGKQWSVVSKLGKKNFSFITVLYPYKGYDNRLDEDSSSPKIKGWELNDIKWNLEGDESTSLSKGNETLFFEIEKVVIEGVNIEFSEAADVFIKLKGKQLIIKSLKEKDIHVSFKNEKPMLLKPGEVINYEVE